MVVHDAGTFYMTNQYSADFAKRRDSNSSHDDHEGQPHKEDEGWIYLTKFSVPFASKH